MKTRLTNMAAVGAVSSAVAALSILLAGVSGPLWAALWGLTTGSSVGLAALTMSVLSAPDRLDWVEDYSTLRRP